MQQFVTSNHAINCSKTEAEARCCRALRWRPAVHTRDPVAGVQCEERTDAGKEESKWDVADDSVPIDWFTFQCHLRLRKNLPYIHRVSLPSIYNKWHDCRTKLWHIKICLNWSWLTHLKTGRLHVHSKVRATCPFRFKLWVILAFLKYYFYTLKYTLRPNI